MNAETRIRRAAQRNREIKFLRQQIIDINLANEILRSEEQSGITSEKDAAKTRAQFRKIVMRAQNKLGRIE